MTLHLVTSTDEFRGVWIPSKYYNSLYVWDFSIVISVFPTL